MEPTPSVPDLLLRIMQQQDSGFAEIRQSQSKLVDTMNRIDRDVALLQAGSEQLKEIPRRVQSLESSRDTHARQLAEAMVVRDRHDERIGDLEDVSATRRGWEGMGGKLLYLIGGSVITGIITGIALALRT